MKIILKSGEYYDYYSIKTVEILNDDIVKINGNFEKGKKGKEAQIRTDTIINIKEFNKFLKNEMKEFHADGVCQYCGSLNVVEQRNEIRFKKLNKPKEKPKLEKYAISGYRCNVCGKLFSELKPIDLVIYYK